MSDPYSDPSNDFSAGPRLGPPRRGAPPPPAPRRKAPGPKRKRGLLGKILGWAVTGLYSVVFLAIIMALLGGAAGFLYFSSSLPSVDALKTYKPPLESRIYASNFQLLDEPCSPRGQGFC